MYNLLKRRSQGSMTVEAALIIPIILLIMALIIYTFLVIHQKALLTRTASLAAQQGAEIWMNERYILDGHSDNIGERIPLHTLYEPLLNSRIMRSSEAFNIEPGDSHSNLDSHSGNDQDITYQKIINMVRIQLEKGLITADSTEMRIDYSNLIVQGKIDVTLRQELILPFAGFMDFFGGRDRIILESVGTAAITQPVEYIRDFDLVLEYASRLKEKFKLEDKLEGLKKKIFITED